MERSDEMSECVDWRLCRQVSRIDSEEDKATLDCKEIVRGGNMFSMIFPGGRCDKDG